MQTALRPVPDPLSVDQQLELQASMARHPAGKQRGVDLSRCPTCGQNASGALGEAALSL